MMDNKMICTDLFENVVENGEATGFAFLGRLPYYRGLGLSMIEDIAVTVDGEAIPREAIRFTETEYGDRWNFGEKARITALKTGGLSPGEHKIEFAVRMRVSYLPFVPTTKDTKALKLAA
jgi:hypothetical protein